jgi:hypothetical protein
MPLNDWQFWIVTLAAAAALSVILWRRRPWRSASGRCPSCASGESNSRSSKRKVALTIERRIPG